MNGLILGLASCATETKIKAESFVFYNNMEDYDVLKKLECNSYRWETNDIKIKIGNKKTMYVEICNESKCIYVSGDICHYCDIDRGFVLMCEIFYY